MGTHLDMPLAFLLRFSALYSSFLSTFFFNSTRSGGRSHFVSFVLELTKYGLSFDVYCFHSVLAKARSNGVLRSSGFSQTDCLVTL